MPGAESPACFRWVHFNCQRATGLSGRLYRMGADIVNMLTWIPFFGYLLFGFTQSPADESALPGWPHGGVGPVL